MGTRVLVIEEGQKKPFIFNSVHLSRIATEVPVIREEGSSHSYLIQFILAVWVQGCW